MPQELDQLVIATRSLVAELHIAERFAPHYHNPELANFKTQAGSMRITLAALVEATHEVSASADEQLWLRDLRLLTGRVDDQVARLEIGPPDDFQRLKVQAKCGELADALNHHLRVLDELRIANLEKASA